MELWKVSDKNPSVSATRSVYEYYKTLADVHVAANINWGIKMSESGTSFISRQAPMWMSGGSQNRAVYVPVLKGDGIDSPWVSKSVALDQIEAAVEDGWQVVFPADGPDDPETGKDMRKIPFLDDTPDRWVPYNEWHVKKFFPLGLDVLKAQGINFAPGDLRGDAPEGCSDADNISRLSKYKRPSQTKKDMRSATSRGHAIQHFAGNVGVGWGQYDDFASWQAHGHFVDPGDVEELNWHDDTPYRFVSSEGQVVLELPASVKNDEVEQQPTMSLWRKFAKGTGKKSEEKDAELDKKEKSLPLPRTRGW